MRLNFQYLRLLDQVSSSGHRVWLWAVACAVGLVLSAGWAGHRNTDQNQTPASAFWCVGKPVAVAVHKGRASFRAPASKPGSEVMVIVSSLAREKGPFAIQIRAKAAFSAEVPAIAVDGPLAVSTLRSEVRRRHADLNAAKGVPPGERVFHMLVRDGDVYSPSNYTAIPAALRGFGQHSQVYVASEDVASVGDELVADIIHTFDDQIFPVMSRRFGPAPDVNGDGRFTVFLSSWLDHLGGGRYAVDGFVRVADLDLAFRSPLGNQCDMMYLNTALESGPHLRTVMAHEYMHAVLVGQKGRRDGETTGNPQEEEGWLDEAIAHLAEDYCGFSTSNIDYRVNAFLARPERYQLVVDDYYAADLFRSHGNRGSTYLFLKWCAQQYGPDLLPALVHSRLKGADNLEGCTASSFAALYRGWTLDLIQTGLAPASQNYWRPSDECASGKVRPPTPEWELAGPRMNHVGTGTADHWTALGTTSHFAIVDGSNSGAIEIEVVGPPEAELQVTALPLGDDRPRLDLSAVKVRGVDGESALRAHLKERKGVPIRLSQVAWQALSPGANRRRGESQRRLQSAELENTLGTLTLPASGELIPEPIPLRGISGMRFPLVVSVVGIDALGRRVWAWADIDVESWDR